MPPRTSSPVRIQQVDPEGDHGAWERAALALARQVDIGILRGKELKAVALRGLRVVGALFDEFDGQEYSFDVVVDPAEQGQGIGGRLMDMGIAEGRMFEDADGRIVLDAVNPQAVTMLERRGFHVKRRERDHVILERSLVERARTAGPRTSLSEETEYGQARAAVDRYYAEAWERFVRAARQGEPSTREIVARLSDTLGHPLELYPEGVPARGMQLRAAAYWWGEQDETAFAQGVQTQRRLTDALEERYEARKRAKLDPITGETAAQRGARVRRENADRRAELPEEGYYPDLLTDRPNGCTRPDPKFREEEAEGDGVILHTRCNVHRGGATHHLRYLVDDEAVSGLTLDVTQRKTATIERVFTSPGHRRQGYARALFDYAKGYFRSVKHSKDLTAAGEKWAERVERLLVCAPLERMSTDQTTSLPTLARQLISRVATVIGETDPASEARIRDALRLPDADAGWELKIEIWADAARAAGKRNFKEKNEFHRFNGPWSALSFAATVLLAGITDVGGEGDIGDSLVEIARTYGLGPRADVPDKPAPALTLEDLDDLSQEFNRFLENVEDIESTGLGGVSAGLLEEWGESYGEVNFERGLKYLGHGASRAVFTVTFDGKPAVVKIEDQGAGADANFREADVWAGAPDRIRRWLVPVLAVADDGSWLVMERVGTSLPEGIRLKKLKSRKALEKYGIEDIAEGRNIADDGRVFDYAGEGP